MRLAGGSFGLPATYLFFFIKFEKSKHYIDDFFS